MKQVIFIGGPNAGKVYVQTANSPLPKVLEVVNPDSIIEDYAKTVDNGGIVQYELHELSATNLNSLEKDHSILVYFPRYYAGVLGRLLKDYRP